MSIHWGFLPDPDRARALDREMRRQLGMSLRYVLNQCEGWHAAEGARFRDLLADLEKARSYPAATFGWYFELVDRLLEDDRVAARGTLERLAAVRPVTAHPAVHPLRDPDECAISALYLDRMQEDAPDAPSLCGPTGEQAAAFEERYEQARALLERSAPELVAEIDALVHEVIPVAVASGSVDGFHGGSHFQLWGALFFNADAHRTPLALAEAIAHESAHSLLFGFCTEEPLVFNDENELYPSPLRADPRPMDGIYHATYVCARMHWALSRLLDSDVLDAEARTWAHEAREADAANFEAGYSTVAEHGQLSRHGAALMEAARRYMSDAVA